MTDRDTFAAAALTGLLADQSLCDLTDQVLATRAYELAGEMIDEKKRISGIPELFLFDDERDAIQFFADIHSDDEPPHEYAVTLRALLKRAGHV